MVKALFILTVLSTLFGQAFASTNFTCQSTNKSISVTLDGVVPGGITSLNSTTGVITVDGREVARFEEGDMKISLIFRTIKGENNQGDSFKGKITDLGQKSGIIYRLQIPAYGIEYNDFPISCTKK